MNKKKIRILKSTREGIETIREDMGKREESNKINQRTTRVGTDKQREKTYMKGTKKHLRDKSRPKKKSNTLTLPKRIQANKGKERKIYRGGENRG